jgi:hypothetical protein
VSLNDPKPAARRRFSGCMRRAVLMELRSDQLDPKDTAVRRSPGKV